MVKSYSKSSWNANVNLLVEQPNAGEITVELLKATEKEYVETRAAYCLRTSVVEHVLIADPTFKAVHAGENATFTER